VEDVYNPSRRVELYCGKPLLIFHDADTNLLHKFCVFLPPVERCTRIVINSQVKYTEPNIIYVDNQTAIETAIWYASANAVLTTQHTSNVIACGTQCIVDISKYF